MEHPSRLLDPAAIPNLAQPGFSGFDDRFMRMNGIDALGAGGPQTAEQAPDPFGINRAQQEQTADPFGLQARAQSQANQDRFASVNEVIRPSLAPNLPNLPRTASTPQESAAVANLDLGNWREAVAREEEERFIQEARAAAVIALEVFGLSQEKLFQDVIHQQQEEVVRDQTFDPHTGKKKSRSAFVAEATR